MKYLLIIMAVLLVGCGGQPRTITPTFSNSTGSIKPGKLWISDPIPITLQKDEVISVIIYNVEMQCRACHKESL